MADEKQSHHWMSEVSDKIRSSVLSKVFGSEQLDKIGDIVSDIVREQVERAGVFLREEINRLHASHRREIRKKVLWQWAGVVASIVAAAVSWLTK